MPPSKCYQCGGKLKRIRKASSEGSGCIVVLLGILLAPILIGIPIIIVGLYLMGKVEKYYVCRICGQRYE